MSESGGIVDKRLTAARERSAGELQERLVSLCARPVMLMVTDNTRRMLSFRSREGRLEIRAHHMFLKAPEPVLDCLARWMCGKPVGEDLVQRFIDVHSDDIRQAPPVRRPLRVKTRGRCLDLRELQQYLNEAFLQNRSKADVTWGRRVTRRSARTIRLGWYDESRNLIGISRRLDGPDIPRYVVEAVLFHEMLHEILGVGERPDGKRDIHGKTFRLLEQTYPHYEQARAFEKERWG